MQSGKQPQVHAQPQFLSAQLRRLVQTARLYAETLICSREQSVVCKSFFISSCFLLNTESCERQKQDVVCQIVA